MEFEPIFRYALFLLIVGSVIAFSILMFIRDRLHSRNIRRLLQSPPNRIPPRAYWVNWEISLVALVLICLGYQHFHLRFNDIHRGGNLGWHDVVLLAFVCGAIAWFLLRRVIQFMHRKCALELPVIPTPGEFVKARLFITFYTVGRLTGNNRPVEVYLRCIHCVWPLWSVPDSWDDYTKEIVWQDWDSFSPLPRQVSRKGRVYDIEFFLPLVPYSGIHPTAFDQETMDYYTWRMEVRRRAFLFSFRESYEIPVFPAEGEKKGPLEIQKPASQYEALGIELLPNGIRRPQQYDLDVLPNLVRLRFPGGRQLCWPGEEIYDISVTAKSRQYPMRLSYAVILRNLRLQKFTLVDRIPSYTAARDLARRFSSTLKPARPGPDFLTI